ncbi:DUF2505 domain-containing protein [Paeniglutamicibacter cryotolerans]|uniref:DUF2505 domain-containing protein n=1 Tax=Paeniglutamicibacter cryotolerans TaxID=670079 RepID=A0A839QPU3_9MICC|nr:DUF2505 domain-containing protein [Paeniglutamicibacter cryotolerans]MBB2996006.1 hypothetical protein [Paeniglutamicibacter cryotolerans]
MALNASTDLSYSPAEVLATLTDRGFAEHITAIVGGTLKEFTLSGDTSGAFELSTVRAVPTDRAPEMARKFVGATVDVTQKESWSAPGTDGSRSAQVAVTVAGIPVNVAATQRVDATDAGSRLTLDGQVTSSIPFLGGKIASAAEPFISKALKLQADQLAVWNTRSA